MALFAVTGAAVPVIATSIAALGAAPAAAKAVAQVRKLHQAADQFEGILIGTLWSAFQNDPLNASDSDPGSGTEQSLGVQAMSTALAASGGLGIAAMMERQLMPPAAASRDSKKGMETLKSQFGATDTMAEARSAQANLAEDQR